MQKQNTLGSQNQNKMAVIGCGNLGLPLCAVLADADDAAGADRLDDTVSKSTLLPSKE